MDAPTDVIAQKKSGLALIDLEASATAHQAHDGFAAHQGAEVVAQHLATGQRLASARLDMGAAPPTAAGRTIKRDDIALGYADGTIRLGTLRAVVSVIKADQLPKGLTALANGDRTDGTAVYSPLPGDQFRRVSFEAKLGEPERIVEGAGIRAIDYHRGGTAERPSFVVVTVDDRGAIRLSRGEGSVNMLTQQLQMTVETATLPALPAGARVARLASTDTGDQVYVADEGGTVYRFDTRDLKAPVLAETADLLPGDARLSSFGFLLGHQSLVVGGSDGSVRIFFRLQRRDAGTKDGFTLVRAHELEPQGAPITGLSPSLRTKLFATADARGEVWVRHATSERTLLKLAKSGPAGAYRDVVLAPRDDGVLAIDEAGRATFWSIDIPHPETTLKTIFGKVWYEGYDAPSYTWQSSAGTDSFEPKLSLVPLIFGTIKATLYALLFAVPIALLAAIFTSEFCHPAVRARMNRVSHHPVREGAMQCSSCHDVHGSNPKLVAADWVNETCYQCHAEKRGPFLWEHQPVREDCTLCHRPHGSVHASLLKNRAPWLCQQCHLAPQHPSTAYSGTGLPGATIPSGAQQMLGKAGLNSHSEVHGSNHPSGPRKTR